MLFCLRNIYYLQIRKWKYNVPKKGFTNRKYKEEIKSTMLDFNL